MRYRDAKKLKVGDTLLLKNKVIDSSANDIRITYTVSSIEVFVQAKTVRIYVNDGIILYNEEVELINAN